MTAQLIFTLLTAVAVIAAGSALVSWGSRRSRHRAEFMQFQSQRMAHALRAYSNWIELQRGLPCTEWCLDELTSPPPLREAAALKRETFPSLHAHIVGLLMTHNELTEYLWQTSLLRLSQGSAWCEPDEDLEWQRLRHEQEELIEEIIAICRALTLLADRPWMTRAAAWPRLSLTGQQAPQHQ